MPVGTIGTDRSTGSQGGKVSRDGRTGVRAAGAGQGSAVGTGYGRIDKSSGPLKSKDPGGYIGSANAAIGTFAQDRTALNDAYGGPLDDTGFLGRILGYRTYKNPISGQPAGWGVDIGSLIGSGIGMATGIPGLGMLGSALDITANFGPEFGAWRGTGSQGTGSPSIGGGRGTGYVARGGMGAPSAPSPSAFATPAAFQNVPSMASAVPWGLPGYSADTRFGRGTVQPYGMFG